MSDSSSPDRPSGFFHWLKSLRKSKNGNDSLREALEEFMDEIEEGADNNPSIATHEKNLLSNILKLRDLTVHDVMIPRADIAAIDKNASQDEIFALLAEKQFSRIPVYRETLDDIIGAVHVKDIVSQLAARKTLDLFSIIRDLPIVSPAMPALDLLLFFREAKKHMVVVVDEFGGTDGLVTINDVIVTIVGEVDDEFDAQAPDPEIEQKPDGSMLADARLEIELLEEKMGHFLNADERDEIDTLGGLVFAIAGRVPARGEVLHHKESGFVFEIIDADPRRVNRVRIKKAA